MSRGPRILSNSGIYHLISRGIDKMDIFVDDYDYEFFLESLNRFANEENAEVHCYCLMDNHYHLLIKTNNLESPARLMKRINVKYAMYFNRKYERLGPLFQERYKSECIEDDEYYRTVFRYILRNPVKAGIVADPFEYKWSSAHELESGYTCFTNISYICSIVSKKEAIRFIKERTDEVCADVSEGARYASDRTAKRVFESKYTDNVLMDVRFFDDEHKLDVINMLRSDKCSIRQISRLTGIPRGIIKRLTRVS